jgi:hypothetical protein
MAYATRDYWVFGLCPSSGILRNTKENNVSECRFVSVLWRGGWETPTLLAPLETADLSHWTGVALSNAAHTRSIMLRKIVLRNTSLPLHDQVNQHHTRSIMLHNTQCCAT